MTRQPWEKPQAELAAAMSKLNRDAVRALWIDPTVANGGDLPDEVLRHLAGLNPVQLFGAVIATVQEAARIGAGQQLLRRRVTALEDKVAAQGREIAAWETARTVRWKNNGL